MWKDSTIRGEYLACLLYKSYLLLASVSKTDTALSVIMVIALGNARVEEATHGQGI